MGNLRGSYTEKEWDDLVSKIENDRKAGKPDDILLHLSIWQKPVEVLIRLKRQLGSFYSPYELSLLDEWIKWKTLNNR